MEARRQGISGVYIWETPDRRAAIHLPYDLLDRILADVMRGFAAVPRRGAEIGGLLIGTARGDDRLTVRLEDIEPVACEYKHGPSYIFSDADRESFAAAVAKWDRSDIPYAIGFYRSHTREGLAPTEEDRALFAVHFQDPASVFLLIKPAATKPSSAGFFLPENGKLPENTPLEFPFHRRELGGEEPRRRSPREPRPEAPAPAEQSVPAEEPARSRPASATRSRGWLWVPLSCIFLLIGLALGYFAARSFGPSDSAKPVDSLGLGLSVSHSGENLNVRWNRESQAIRTAPRGMLVIRDGDQSPPPLQLDSTLLQAGSVVYRRSSREVMFRLEVYPQRGLTVSQSIEWHAP